MSELDDALESQIYRSICRPRIDDCKKEMEEKFVNKDTLTKSINKILIAIISGLLSFVAVAVLSALWINNGVNTAANTANRAIDKSVDVDNRIGELRITSSEEHDNYTKIAQRLDDLKSMMQHKQNGRPTQ